MTRSRATFDSWAPTYELSVLQPLLFEPVHRTVLELVHENARLRARLLDVGCGTGRLLGAVQDGFATTIGVDPSTAMLASATQSRNGLRFVCAAAEYLPFETGAFDVVIAILSLGHWQNPALGIRELARVLSPAGVCLVADADIEEEDRRSRRRFDRPRGRAMALLLMGCGLDVVDHRLAPVHGPVPNVHVLVARPRPISG
jgi:ubiquinone/menaquinone biosynthesis C-methylase UbiE